MASFFVGFQAEIKRANISDPVFTQCPDSTWLFFELHNKDYLWVLPYKIMSLNRYKALASFAQWIVSLQTEGSQG